ncbi:MAG TPA: sensor domain-containing diguanylate cyclase [Candidatus Elarobacter sp.]|nr:sensor domain-containing diguanylate cyclase [Candidatus Elarobacter sp.]
MLSVATAPVDARQRLVAYVVIAVLTAASFALFPFASRPLPAATAAVPFLLGIALAAHVVTAYLLFSQFLANRLLGTAVLAAAYLGSGVLMLAYVVSFPAVVGAVFSPQVSPWTWVAWHVLFPAAVAVALAFDRAQVYVADAAAARRWLWIVLGGGVAAGALPALAIVVHAAALKPIVTGNQYASATWTSIGGEALVLLNVAVLVLAVVWTRGRTVLQTWLIVALVASCLDVQIAHAGGARFTAGWYFGRFLVVCSSGAVLWAYLRQLHVMFAELSDLSMVDGLTTLPNRRYFETRLHDAIRLARRAGRPLALLMADVDAFKQYNDTYGHLAGDEALKCVAAALRASALRPGDVFARWGGEEFAALLPDTDTEGAYLVAERLRAAIAAIAIPHSCTPVAARIVTISVGIAVLGGPGDDPDYLIARADSALYRAKSCGRNGVSIELTPLAEELPAPVA